MLSTIREMQCLVNMVSFTLIFLEPDATIGDADMATHNHLYSDFAYSQSAVIAGGSMVAALSGIFDDEEDD